jgi:hypothetical protein
MEKGLDSSCTVRPFGRTLSVRLVTIGTIVIIIPFFVLHLFMALALLMEVFDLATYLSTATDVTQISVILVLSSATFLRWSEVACRVPVLTLSVVRLMTSCFIITVECWINHGCCVQHRLEALHVWINIFVVLW